MTFHVAYSTFTKAVGVTFNNPNGESRQKIIRKKVRPGMRLNLMREPNNPYDPYAFAVVLPSGEQIGYLSRRTAENYVKFVDNRTMLLTAVVKDVTDGGLIFKRTYGVNIEITVLEKDPPYKRPK